MNSEILLAALGVMGLVLAAAKAATAKKAPVPVKVEKKTELRRK